MDDELYDERTRAALDRGGPVGALVARPPRPVVSGWRGSVGGAAILTAAMIGVADVLDVERRDPVVEEIDLAGSYVPTQPVEVDFVPGAPALTRCRVHPWLF
jgi:hypothetical protein